MTREVGRPTLTMSQRDVPLAQRNLGPFQQLNGHSIATVSFVFSPVELFYEHRTYTVLSLEYQSLSVPYSMKLAPYLSMLHSTFFFKVKMHVIS